MKYRALLLVVCIPWALALGSMAAMADATNVLASPTASGIKPSFGAEAADLAFAAYNKTFYVVESGRGYYREDTAGGRNHFWTQAEEIEMILDNWERTHSPDARTRVVESIAGFVDHFGTNWLSNKYNDDLLWMVIATSRAFLVTSNSSYQALARYHFDATYARAWSTNLGGGLWWSTDNGGKNACVNGPGAVAGCYLFKLTGDRAYLEKARAIYDWERANLFEETSGAVRDNMRRDGRIGRRVFTYNTGTFIGAANSLFQLTGDKSLLADAEKAAAYTRGTLSNAGILPGYGGGDAAGFNGIFVRYLVRFARENQLGAKYRDWLLLNANAAWNSRRADNLAWNRWDTPTPEGPLRAWACADTVVILQLVPPETP